MNNIEILEKLKDEQYTRETLNTICMFYNEEFKPYVLSTEEREALENLIQENKELKEHCKDLIKEKQELTAIIEDDCLSKSKVKEKIVELEEQLKYNLFKTHEIYTVVENKLLHKIEALKELLEEGE